MLSIDTLVDWLIPTLEIGHSNPLWGFYRAKFTFSMYCNPMLTRGAYHLMALTTTSLTMFQMIVLTKTPLSYEQFDFYIILKVTAAIFNMDWEV